MSYFGGDILAAMITPAFGYAGLGAAALPILIHLFNRRRFRRVRWAATDFLLEAERRNRRRMRLEELILLGLRCLAMAFLGLMLSRLFVKPQSLVAALGSNTRTEHFIVLDDSYSTTALANASNAAITGGTADADATARDGGTVFGKAREAALQVIKHIREVAPEDPVTVIAASRPDQPIRSASAVAQIPAQAWADDINAIPPSFHAGNMPAALKEVRGLLDSHKSALRAAVYVVSDFQAVDWLSAADKWESEKAGKVEGGKEKSVNGTVSGPAAVLAGWADRNRSLDVLLIDVGHKIASNRCIVGIRPEQSQALAGVVGRYLVRVANFGEETAPAGQMQVYAGDTALPPVPVPALPANQTADVPVEIAFGQEGSQRLTVELQPDALPADNTRSTAVPVEHSLRILLVNGEASPDPYQDEAFLLNVALRPEGPEFSGNDTTIINENELEVADLADYHVVALLNVNRITEQSRARLEEYAKNGGGVVFFLGDQVDGAGYNRLLYRNGEGILPVKLGDQITAPDRQPGYRLTTSELDSPVVRRFGRAAPTLLGDSLVWQWFGCELPSVTTQRTEAIPKNKTTQPEERSPTRVLMQLADQDHTPMLVERRFGAGRVLLFASSADKEWNNLADQPVYVVLMMELMQYVARPADGLHDTLVGEPIRLPLNIPAYEPTALLKLPTFPSTPAMRIEARGNDRGQYAIEWADTSRPGLYQFELQRSGGEAQTRQIAVNLDPRESDVRRADRQALIASMGELKPAYVTGETLADYAPSEARQELWPFVLSALLMVLMLEQGLAWWFGADKNWRRAFRRPTTA